ncbi:MAG: flagellar biosynthesis protein FlhA, partial [Candidatus Poribacteria bacterium]|nr:flagellar biosynthesis protein FlhA [Candidatus Poribacteria bacterium]
MNGSSASRLLKGYGGSIFIAISVISILLVMVFPLPGQFLDFLLTFNITFAIVILLLSIYVSKPLDLYIFPSLLLITTLYRLALNLASTRLILSHASYTDPKTGVTMPNLRAAGDVIKVFGELVGGDNAVVGFIIFVILVTIQYIVITNGAQRVAEVRARFTLDAMPGKQMAIDADLNAGLIDETQARQRRMDIESEQDFYGAMDGASKFVKGDAIAAIIIVIINILGGIVVGVVQKGLPFTEAVKTYTILTVGDGLVSQIPALVISTATGLVITRAASDEDLGQDVTRQLLSQPKALVVAAITLVALLMISPLPRLPLILGIVTLVGLAVYLLNKERFETIDEMGAEERQGGLEQEMLQTPEVDRGLVKIGYGVIPFVDEEQGGALLE